MSATIINQKTCEVCNKPTHARGYCHKHYHKLKRQGLLWFDKNYRNRTPEEKFWRNTQKTKDCWVWTGAIFTSGYGRIFVNNKSVSTSRFSWKLHYGPIPDRLFVLHRCDNKICVNPNHLFVGTHQDNMDDMVKKGRQPKGERNGQSVLKEADILEMYRLFKKGLSGVEISRRYNISNAQVINIKNGKSWAHLNPT